VAFHPTMQSCTVCAVLFLSLIPVDAVYRTTEDHPITRVINLLKDLKTKSEAKGKEEEVSYGKFQYWCERSEDNLDKAIANENEQISTLEDEIAGNEQSVKDLETEIQNLDDEILKYNTADAAATKKRGEEQELHTEKDENLDKTIQAIKDCIKLLKDAETETEKEALIQRKQMLSLIESLQTYGDIMNAEPEEPEEPTEPKRPEQLAKGDMKKHIDKYDFKSESVIEILKDLQHKFETKKQDGIKAETNSLNAYDVTKLARDNAIAAATKSKEAKGKEKGKIEAQLIQDKSNLEGWKGDLEADEKTLAATKKKLWRQSC